VRRGLCYWTSNKPLIASEFSRLQWTLKFADDRGVTDPDVCMFVYMCARSFLPRVLYTVWCLSKLHAHGSVCEHNL
jgi:hypothetical protein